MRKRSVGITAGAIILTVILCCVFILQSKKEEPVQTITVTPEQGTVFTLEYGQPYEDPGAAAVYTCDGETVALSVHNRFVSLQDV